MQTQHFLFIGDPGPAAKARTHMILPRPKIEPLHEVFAEAMLEDSSVRQRRNPLEWLASYGVHIAILAVLLILPLYFTTGLNLQKFNLSYLAPPAPVASPPPPTMASAANRPSRVVPQRVYTPGKLTGPTFIPKVVAITPGNLGAPPDEALTGIAGGVPGGVPGGVVGGSIGGVLGGVLNGVAPPAPPVAAATGPKSPVRVGGEVKQPRLIYGPEPEYPILARQSRLSGVVIIEAVIDEHGDVKGMRVISGHPLLVPAALSAVSKRKYEPTILDGEPTPIDLRVEISFSFS